ncbi:thymidylate kinase [Arthrobacter sp. MYb227]|uniref:dTMP kinase n=1 Tax=Arthrobacter sp. MYb227 TaxID=1848601 RepID=UPI000CFC57AB|nr:thymidylate kinase [Arthrobacter sp. MYb227]PQZ89609.1 thymidylate kinase [Arthrobacter sp. MYb227]
MQRPAYPRTIALLGIDGAGKSTVAQMFATDLRTTGMSAQIMRNPSGRRWASRMTARFGAQLSPLWANRLEWAVRCANVLYAHGRATRFPGITVMDRHIPCQLVLQALRGFPTGRILPWLFARLPRPEVIVLIDVPAELAYQRIMARGEDHEAMDYLLAARSAYLGLARRRGWHVVDGSGSPRNVADAVARAALPLGSTRLFG